MLMAQAAAEYGAISALASALQSLVYRIEDTVTARGATVWLVIGAGVLVWWFFLRSK